MKRPQHATVRGTISIIDEWAVTLIAEMDTVYNLDIPREEIEQELKNDIAVYFSSLDKVFTADDVKLEIIEKQG